MKRVNLKFEFDSIMYPYSRLEAIKVITKEHAVDEYVKFINDNHIEQAQVIMPSLNFIKFCPSLKYLYVSPSFDVSNKFDFSPLYDLEKLKYLICENVYGNKLEFIADIDYSRLNGLEFLSFTMNRGIKNLMTLQNLKTLVARDYKGKMGDLTNLFVSEKLDTLELNECKVSSLNGIEKSKKLQCLYLNYNRALKDITALNKVKSTLKALSIQKCPKIEDFSVLEELENVEFLELIGNNSLPDLSFLKGMKNLKTFIFEYNVMDGDLTPCLGLEFACCDKWRKHYNLKDSALPKGKYIRGNENIEEWRRLE